MSDIYVFRPTDEDYDSMGVVGALLPTECTFEETANGESIISLTHPIDELGRYAALERGNILVVPIPVRTTPEIQNGRSVSVVWSYKVKNPVTTHKNMRTIYRKATGGKMRVMNPGDTFTVVYKPDGDGPWKVKSKYGTGWVPADPNELTFDLVKTYTGLENNANFIQEIQSPWTITPQYFRIYETKKGIDSISVSARHISYDLLYNVTTYENGNETALQTAINGILNGCYSDHGFAGYTNLDNVQVGLYYNGKNPIEAFLDPEEGICKKYEVGLVRDNYELFFLQDPGINRGVRIQYGKNMTGVDFTESDDEVVTRVIPVGELKNGDELYLDDDVTKRYIDITDYAEAHPEIAGSIPSYPFSHVHVLECENCKVGDKDPAGGTITVNSARIRMREQANKLFENGCYNPKIQMSVEFVNLGDTVEYEQFKNLENCFLFDYVIVQHPRLFIDVTAQIVKIKWDCLKDRMTGVEIGSVGETIGNIGITTWQIPAGFSGSKIAMGTLGSKALQKDIISADHIQSNTINVRTLNAEEITAYVVTAVQGNFTSLAAGQITTDELYATLAQIASAELKQASIEYADVNELVVNTIATIAQAQIEEADITTAKIGNADVEKLAAALASIIDAQIEHAEIDNALIDWAAIRSLTAQMASIANGNMGNVQIGKASIEWADIDRMCSQFADISSADIGDAEIRQALINQLTAEVTETMSLKAKNAEFDFASAQRLLASAMILDQGVAGTVSIENLVATSAAFVQATMGTLILKGEDSNYYEVTISNDGEIHTNQVDSEGIEEYAAEHGKTIVETSAVISELDSTNIRAQNAIIATIFTDALTAHSITASQAFLASATVPELYVTSITAIGNDLDLRANESINLIVGRTLTGYKRYYLSQPANLDPPTVPTENPPSGDWVDIEPDYSRIGVKNFFGPNTNPTLDAYLDTNGEVVSDDGWDDLDPDDFPEFSGKNLLPLTLEDLKDSNYYDGSWDGNEYTDSGVTFTINTNEYGTVTSIVANGTATQYGAYLMLPFNSGFPNKFLEDGEDYILNGCIGGSKQTYYIDMSLSNMEQGMQSVIEIYSTDGDASFTYDSSYDPFLNSIIIREGYTANNVVFYPMVRRAGEDDTFEPYENAIFKDTFYTDVDRSSATYYRCVVSDQYGHSVTSDAALLSVGEAGMPIVLKHPTDVHTLISIGKNKFGPNEAPIEDGYINSEGSIITGQSGSAGWTISDYIPVTPETNYYFKPNTTAGNSAKHAFYTEDLTYISTINSGPGTFTTPSNCHYMRFSYRSTSESIQLELGTSATTYEEYSSTGSDVNIAIKVANASSYQWQYKPVSGETWYDIEEEAGYSGFDTNELAFNADGLKTMRVYKCVVTNEIGSVETNFSKVLFYLPIVLSQPQNVFAARNSIVQLTVEAENVASYQWQWKAIDSETWADLSAGNTSYPGGTTKTVSFELTPQRAAASRHYRCILTNSAGIVITDVVAATIDTGTNVYIVKQPSNFFGVIGDTATFTVDARNVNDYRWQRSDDQGETWANLSTNGAYTDTYYQTISAERATWLYRCRMRNSDEAYTYTEAVAMVVVDNISITTQPADQEGKIGDVAAFTVTATGTIPLSYRWQMKNSWIVSDYIEVLSDREYYFQPNSSSNYYRKHAYYDEDFNLISVINSGPIAFTTPEDCFYMRFSYRITSYDIQLEYGDTPTTYEEYIEDQPYNLYYVDLLEYAGENENNWSYTDVYLSGGYEASKGATNAQNTADDAYTGVQVLGDNIDRIRDAVGSLVVGGVNLIDDSDTITIEGTGPNSYHTLASGLSANTIYTLSMASASLVEGSASSMTIEVIRTIESEGSSTDVESSISTYVPSYERIDALSIDSLDFSAGSQSITFVTADDPGTYALRIYAGAKGYTTGVIVELKRVKLELGTFATMWTESQDDLIRRIEKLQTSLNVLNTGVQVVTTRVIGEYTTDEYGNLIKDGSAYSDTSSMDGQLTTIQDFFEFDTSVAGDPKLRIRTKKSGNDDSSIGSNMYMELGKTSLNFYLGATKVAYFTDNKLHVTNVEAKERVSVGTDSNGFLDIYTTSGGVAFVWRS